MTSVFNNEEAGGANRISVVAPKQQLTGNAKTKVSRIRFTIATLKRK
jgi:hypothetical protein